MKCPNCKKETSCGCNSCKDRPHSYERNVMKGDFITCPYCEKTEHCDTWLNNEYKVL